MTGSKHIKKDIGVVDPGDGTLTIFTTNYVKHTSRGRSYVGLRSDQVRELATQLNKWLETH